MADSEELLTRFRAAQEPLIEAWADVIDFRYNGQKGDGDRAYEKALLQLTELLHEGDAVRPMSHKRCACANWWARCGSTTSGRTRRRVMKDCRDFYESAFRHGQLKICCGHREGRAAPFSCPSPTPDSAQPPAPTRTRSPHP